METQDEATLTEYFTTAMQILSDADLPNNGLTQPWTYHGDEAMYARAILAAEKRVNGRKVTHNFLHVDFTAPIVPPRITHLDEEAGEAVVSIWTGTNDYIWNTQERGRPEQQMSPETLADRFLSADGQTGRLAVLMQGGGPLVLVTHWQSLYSNGSRLGFETYREVAARVSALLGRKVAWRKLSEITHQFLAAQTARFESCATLDSMEVKVCAPFATDVLTFSVPTPWPLYTGPSVEIDGKPAASVADAEDLAAGRWLMRGSVVTVSLALERNVPRTVTITPRKPI
jgi:hypothetical protein